MGDEEDEDEEEFDWQVEQEVYKETSEEELRAMQTYGFGNQRSGVFARLQVRLWVMRTSSAVIRPSFVTHFIKMTSFKPLQQEELSDVIDVKNPEGTTAAERRRHRLDAERSAFSSDHYL